MAHEKAIEPRQIRAVFFDAGDTLHELIAARPAILAALLAEAGVSLPPAARAALEEREDRELGRIWDACNLLYPDEESGQRYLSVECRAILRRLGVDGGPERAEQVARGIVRASWRRLFPDTVPTLDALRGRFRLGIISNAGSYMRRVYQELGVTEQVDFLIISGEVGVEKPDPAIFRLALEEAGIQPQEALHVGDNPLTDVAGARAVGITPVLLARSGVTPRDARCRTLSSLAELLPLLVRRVPDQ